MKFRYTERSKKELEIAYSWYEKQQNGLGEYLLSSIENLLQIISEFPESTPIIYKNFRRFYIKRFPFTIIYTIEGNEIIIHALFHTSQDPKKQP